MFRWLVFGLLGGLVLGCSSTQTGTPSACEGIDLSGYVFNLESGVPRIHPDLALYFPECANEILLGHGLQNLHVATFEERRNQFGPLWEESFRIEACVNRTWRGRVPSICQS